MNDYGDPDIASTFIPFQPVLASTYQRKFFVINAAAVAAESSSQLQEVLDELEWREIINTPRIRTGLRRLAAEALREFASGETEEGGFAVE